MSRFVLKPFTLPIEEEFVEDRCSQRTNLAIPARLRMRGDASMQVTVTDLSIAGFGCPSHLMRAPGTICWITMPGLGSLQAEVIHNNGQRMGCAFDNLLAPAVYDMLVSRYKLPDTV